MTGQQLKRNLNLHSLRENACVFEGMVDGGFPIRVVAVYDTYNRRMYETHNFSFLDKVKCRGELGRSGSLSSSMPTFILYEGKGFTISDMQKNALSQITRKYYDEVSISKQVVERAYWDKKRKTLNVVVSNYKEASKTTISMKGRSRSSSFYRVTIRFEQVKTQPTSSAELLHIFDTNTALVHSSDPSWIYQGMWKLASELQYAIHPFPSDVKDTGVWRAKHMKGHDAPYVSKHIVAAIDYIKQHPDQVERVLAGTNSAR